MGNAQQVDEFEQYDASGGGGKRFLQAGRGRVRVLAFKHKTAQASKKGTEAFIAELQVISHTPMDGAEQLLEGETVSYVTTRHAQWPQYYVRDVKRILGAASNEDPDSINGGKVNLATSIENPLAGVELDFVGITPPGKDRPSFQWFAVGGEGAAASVG